MLPLWRLKFHESSMMNAVPTGPVNVRITGEIIGGLSVPSEPLEMTSQRRRGGEAHSAV